jgi:hypothetical protein
MDANASTCVDLRSTHFGKLLLAFGARDAPLGSRTRVSQAADEVAEGAPIAGEWWAFTRSCWREHRSKLGQFCVRESRVPVMHAMIRLVEQSETREPPKPPVGYDASRGTVHRRAG